MVDSGRDVDGDKVLADQVHETEIHGTWYEYRDRTRVSRCLDERKYVRLNEKR